MTRYAQPTGRKLGSQTSLDRAIEDAAREGKPDLAEELREIRSENYGTGSSGGPLSLDLIKGMSREEVMSRKEEVQQFLSGGGAPAALDPAEIRTTADLKKLTAQNWADLGEDGRDALLARVRGGRS